MTVSPGAAHFAAIHLMLWKVLHGTSSDMPLQEDLANSEDAVAEKDGELG